MSVCTGATFTFDLASGAGFLRTLKICAYGKDYDIYGGFVTSAYCTSFKIRTHYVFIFILYVNSAFSVVLANKEIASLGTLLSTP